MIFSIVNAVYFLNISTGIVAGVKDIQRLLPNDRWILCLLMLIITSEAIATVFRTLFHLRIYTYRVFNPVQLWFVCKYFYRHPDLFPKSQLPRIVAVSGIVFAVINGLFIQPFNQPDTNFLLFEAAAIILLCVVSFFKMLKMDILLAKPFWICTILITHWCYVFFHSGLFWEIWRSKAPAFQTITYLFWLVNLLTYGGFALYLTRCPKIKS